MYEATAPSQAGLGGSIVVVMAFVVMAHVVMAYVVMAHIHMACVRSDITLASRTRWLHYSYGLCSYGRYSYGLCTKRQLPVKP